MKQMILCLGALCLPVIVFCQTGSLLSPGMTTLRQAQGDPSATLRAGSGIKWVEGLSWQQIKQKAKKENKYIFVDCFTTWCGPCKKMDKEVYTIDSVGDLLNKGFIPVKVQMDQTKNDDAGTKSWYKTAKSFEKEYNINAYPSILFFTPAGELAFRETGYKEAQELITAARNAKDPSKQFYLLLKNYKKGKLDDAATRSLINSFKQLGDTTNYRALRDNYFAKLRMLPKEKLYTKDNIEFIASIISRRTQVVFDLFYPDGSLVDKVMEKKGYAIKVADEVIMKEKVAPVLNVAMDSKIEPDWNILFNGIAKEYNDDYADRVILKAKIEWYSRTGDIMKWAIALNDKMDKYGTDTTDRGEEFRLNNAAFIFFGELGRTSKLSEAVVTELSRVSVWMEGVARRGETGTGIRLQQWPLYIDTYANLLYKLGNKEEAIKWQEVAVRKGHEVKADEGDIKIFEENLKLMKKGWPTWPIEENGK